MQYSIYRAHCGLGHEPHMIANENLMQPNQVEEYHFDTVSERMFGIICIILSNISNFMWIIWFLDKVWEIEELRNIAWKLKENFFLDFRIEISCPTEINVRISIERFSYSRNEKKKRFEKINSFFIHGNGTHCVRCTHAVGQTQISWEPIFRWRSFFLGQYEYDLLAEHIFTQNCERIEEDGKRGKTITGKMHEIQTNG